MHSQTEWYQLLKSDNPNYFEVIQAYEEYFRTHPYAKSAQTKEYKTWLQMVGTNYDAQGNLIVPDLSVEKEQEDLPLRDAVPWGWHWRKRPSTSGARWSCIGPKKVDIYAPSSKRTDTTTQGVTRSSAVDPNDSNRILVGTQWAGIWLSEDKGMTWKCVTEDLYVSSVTDIAFCFNHSQTVYAITNIGPIKSTDGGKTWSTTGFDQSHIYGKNIDIFNNAFDTKMGITVDPNEPNTALFAVSENNIWGNLNGGIWRTTNGGQNWYRVSIIGNFRSYNVKFHPTNSNYIYAGVINNNYQFQYYYSADNGRSWILRNWYWSATQRRWLSYPWVSQGFKHVRFAVTPAAPDNLYILTSFNGVGEIHILTRTGYDLSLTTFLPDLLFRYNPGNNPQDYWDIALAVSSTNSNYIVVGGVHLYKSLDGGNNWNMVDRGNTLVSIPGKSNTYGELHTDIHSLCFFPQKLSYQNTWGSHWRRRIDELWITGDGGVFFSSNQCQSLENRGFGIVAQEVWGFDQAWKSNIMAIGLNHGPIQIRDDDVYKGDDGIYQEGDGWYVYRGADAGSVFVNKGDDNDLYVHTVAYAKDASVYLLVTRSANRLNSPGEKNLGASLPNPWTQYGDVRPMEIQDHSYYHSFYTIAEEPTNQQIATVKKTKDNGDSWENNFNFGNAKPWFMTTSYSDHNVAYLVTRPTSRGTTQSLWKTIDGGKNWTEIPRINYENFTQGLSFSSLTIDGEDSETVWLALGGYQDRVKVVKTTDGGITWKNCGGPTDKYGRLHPHEIHDIAHQIGTQGGVYMATSIGIWYRNDTMDNYHWEQYTEDLPTAIRAKFIQLNYAKNKIRIGTNRGLWECDLYESSKTIAHPMAAKRDLNPGEQVTFVDHSVVRENATYQWSFPGGNPSSSTLEKQDVTYNADGCYDVTLTVTPPGGTPVTTTRKNFIAVGNVNCPEGGDGSATLIPRDKWKVVASSTQTNAGYRQEHAIDGISNLWLSGVGHPHWFRIDLGDVYDIVGFRYKGFPIHTEGRIKEYLLYISDNAFSLGTLASRKTLPNIGSETTITFPTCFTGRYVYLESLSDYGNNGTAAIDEINFLGTLAKVITTGVSAPIDRTNWIITASSNQNIVKHIKDNLENYWQPKDGATYPHHITIDLGKTYTITGFRCKPTRITSYPGIKEFQFKISSDSSNWNTAQIAAQGSWQYGSQGEEKEETFPAQTGRYVRLVVLSSTNPSKQPTIAEFNILGTL